MPSNSTRKIIWGAYGGYSFIQHKLKINELTIKCDSCNRPNASAGIYQSLAIPLKRYTFFCSRFNRFYQSILTVDDYKGDRSLQPSTKLVIPTSKISYYLYKKITTDNLIVISSSKIAI